MSSKLKFSDLFVEYCEMDSDKKGTLLIVQILNLDNFFAVWRLNETDELFMARYLDRTMTKALKNNTLTSKDLFEALYQWAPVSDLNSMYRNSDVAELIEAARAKGYKEEIISGKWKIVKPLSAKEKKKNKEETRKKEVDRQKWKKVRIVSKILLFVSLFIACIIELKFPEIFYGNKDGGIALVVFIVIIIVAAIFSEFKEED